VLAELSAPWQDALQVALLLKDPAGGPLEHRAVCAAFLGIIRRLAAQSPVVIAIDGLQWLDRPSALTLGYALRRLGEESVAPLASVWVGLGDLDPAEVLLTWLERQGRATGRLWTLATAARCQALLLAARGDTPMPSRRWTMRCATTRIWRCPLSMPGPCWSAGRCSAELSASGSPGSTWTMPWASSSPCPPRHGRRAHARSCPASGFARRRRSS
jgi:hypothetical protein